MVDITLQRTGHRASSPGMGVDGLPGLGRWAPLATLRFNL